MQIKKIRLAVNGILLLDKPLGLSSNAALQKARWIFSAEKAGHTGTLDPLASGLLPLCFGEASKFSADLLNADKTYEACLQLGISTDSGDAEGKIISRLPVDVNTEKIAAALARFQGAISQIPPMTSALKHQGRPLYELARQGIVIERAARQVHIHRLEVINWQAMSARLSIAVDCSKGTYIRVLASDMGDFLGCGAHLSALRRTRVGHLDIKNALTLDEIAEKDEAARENCLLPVDFLLQNLPRLDLSEDEARRFSHGNPVDCPAAFLGDMAIHQRFRVYADQVLLGVSELRDERKIWPQRLLRQNTF